MVLGMLVLDATMQEKLLGGEARTASFEDWFQEARAYLDKPALVGATPATTTAALGKFYDQFSLILQGKATSEELRVFTKTLDEEKEELMKANPPAEVNGLRADGWHHLGLAFTRQEDQQAAIGALKEAINIADAAALAEHAALSRATLAQVYLRGTRDIDGALRLALPLWEESQALPPSLTLADLTMTLAETYQQTGDQVEARYFEGAVRELLRKLHCPLDRETPVSEALADWVALLPAEDPKPNFTMKLLKSALVLYARLARLEESRAGEGSAAKFWGSRFREITEVENQVTQVLYEQSFRDNAIMQEIGFLDHGPVEPEDSLSQAEMMGLQELTEGFRTQLDAGVIGDEVVKAMELALHPPVLRATPLLAMSLQWLLAEGHGERGEYEAAVPYFERALATAVSLERLDDALYTISLQLGYLPATAFPARRELCTRAITLIEAARERVGTPYQQSVFLHDKTHFYSLLLLDAFKTENWNLLLQTGSYLKARFPLPLPETAAGTATDFNLRLQAIQEQINGTESTAGEQAELRRLRQRLFDNWLLNQVQHQDARRTPPGISTEMLFGKLAAHEVLLSYYQLSEEVWLVLALNGRGELRAARQIAPAEWLNDRVAETNVFGRQPVGYRARGMEPYGGFTGRRSLIDRAARRQRRREELANWLLPQEVLPVLEGSTRLYICPHRLLHQLAFHALPWRTGFLIEAFAVSYLPSLASLQGPPHTGGKGVVLVGTQDYSDGPDRGLSSLPGAAAEIAGLTKFYQDLGVPVHAFPEAEARRETLLSRTGSAAIAEAAIIHLALHAEDVPGEAPMDARLFLQRGTLDGFDIAQWRLRADLVILSACYAGLRPAGSRGHATLPGDDLFGFQAAFFAAGARQLLGALWPVEDTVGQQLMLKFHAHLRGAEAAVAWQRTVLDYLQAAPEDKRQPLYWAPFFLVEEGRHAK